MPKLPDGMGTRTKKNAPYRCATVHREFGQFTYVYRTYRYHDLPDTLIVSKVKKIFARDTRNQRRETDITRRSFLRHFISFFLGGKTMHLGLGLASNATPVLARSPNLQFRLQSTGEEVRITLDQAPKSWLDGPIVLSKLTLDDALADSLAASYAHENIATVSTPGRQSGQGKVVSRSIEAQDLGSVYLIQYLIDQDHQGDSKLFFGAGSPFANQPLPTTPGYHSLLVQVVNPSADVLMRVTGDITIAALACHKVEWNIPLPLESGNKKFQWQIDFDQETVRGQAYIPELGSLYVAPYGDDFRGTGSIHAPLRTLATASDRSRPGDVIFVRPGAYEPFTVAVSGSPGQPIIYTTLPEEERQAVISGVTAGNRRGGIEIRGKDYIEIRNLVIEDMARDGIFIEGIEGEVHGNHVIAGNLTRRTGNAGIFVCGFVPRTRLTMAETEILRTVDVIIEQNDVSETNVANAYNSNLQNSQSEPGGVNEAITVAAAAGNIITRFNRVHDTRQYGIDYKAGVRGGAIHDNQVWNVERYGIYLDAGRRFIDDIAVYRNQVWNCKAGIVLAREADFDAAEPIEDFHQRLRNIDVYNNSVWDIEVVGIYCQGHPGDGAYGEITDVRVNFNTVVNAGRSGTGREARLSEWSGGDWVASGVVSGFEFVGNILWRSDSDASFMNEFGDTVGFIVSDNLVGIDPIFVDPFGQPPDFRLQAGSPAVGLVGSEHITLPFHETAGQTNRTTSRNAGAF